MGKGAAPTSSLVVPLGCAARSRWCLPSALPGAAFPWEPAAQEGLRTLVPRARGPLCCPGAGFGAKANPPQGVQAALQGGASGDGGSQRGTWPRARDLSPPRAPGGAREGENKEGDIKRVPTSRSAGAGAGSPWQGATEHGLGLGAPGPWSRGCWARIGDVLATLGPQHGPQAAVAVGLPHILPPASSFGVLSRMGTPPGGLLPCAGGGRRAPAWLRVPLPSQGGTGQGWRGDGDTWGGPMPPGGWHGSPPASFLSLRIPRSPAGHMGVSPEGAPGCCGVEAGGRGAHGGRRGQAGVAPMGALLAPGM